MQKPVLLKFVKDLNYFKKFNNKKEYLMHLFPYGSGVLENIALNYFKHFSLFLPNNRKWIF